MIVKESEASNYICCIVDRNCRGKRCMAWKWISKVVKYTDENRLSGSIIPPKPKEAVFERTENGYCGMLNDRY